MTINTTIISSGEVSYDLPNQLRLCQEIQVVQDGLADVGIRVLECCLVVPANAIAH